MKDEVGRVLESVRNTIFTKAIIKLQRAVRRRITKRVFAVARKHGQASLALRKCIDGKRVEGATKAGREAKSKSDEGKEKAAESEVHRLKEAAAEAKRQADMASVDGDRATDEKNVALLFLVRVFNFMLCF